MRNKHKFRVAMVLYEGSSMLSYLITKVVARLTIRKQPVTTRRWTSFFCIGKFLILALRYLLNIIVLWILWTDSLTMDSLVIQFTSWKEKRFTSSILTIKGQNTREMVSNIHKANSSSIISYSNSTQHIQISGITTFHSNILIFRNSIWMHEMKFCCVQSIFL